MARLEKINYSFEFTGTEIEDGVLTQEMSDAGIVGYVHPTDGTGETKMGSLVYKITTPNISEILYTVPLGKRAKILRISDQDIVTFSNTNVLFSGSQIDNRFTSLNIPENAFDVNLGDNKSVQYKGYMNFVGQSSGKPLTVTEKDGNSRTSEDEKTYLDADLEEYPVVLLEEEEIRFDAVEDFIAVMLNNDSCPVYQRTFKVEINLLIVEEDNV